MTASTLIHAFRYERLQQFVKFCLVGGSGVFVDMGVLFLLADPRCLGLNITLSKILSAEAAMTSNFVWNELWTFRPRPSPARRETAVEGRVNEGVICRFLRFNMICGVGIGLAVLLLHLFYTWLGCNLYLSNLLAVFVVTCWNFGMNARLNWRSLVNVTATAKSIKPLLLSLFGLMLTLGNAFASEAVVMDYTMSGAYVCRVTPLSSRQGMRFSYSGNFTGVVAELKWWLRFSPTNVESPDNRITMPKAMIASSDGTNIYQVTIPPPVPPQFLTNRPNTRSVTNRDVWEAAVEMGPVPRRLNSPMLHLWLATASGAANHQSDSNLTVAPWAPPEHLDLAGKTIGVRGLVANATKAPFIPDEIAYVTEDGGTNFHMQVLARTNIGDISIPTSVVIRSGIGPRVESESEINVTAVSLDSHSLDVVPTLNSKCYVQDYRFVLREPPVKLTYFETNWRPMSALEAPYLIEAERARKLSHRSPNWQRLLAMTALVILLSFPMVVGLCRLRAGNRKQQTMNRIAL